MATGRVSRQWGGVFVVIVANVAFALIATSEPVNRAPVVVSIPVNPIGIRGSDGRRHLAYELHVSNFDADTGVLRLERLDVFGDLDRMPLVTYGVADLDDRVMHPGVEQNRRYSRLIEGGRHAVIHVWLALGSTKAIPSSLRHRLVFLTEKGVEQSVDSAGIGISTKKPILIGPPLSQGIWFIHNGPGDHRSSHWGSLLALNGRVTIPERFAVDFIGLDANGRAVKRDFQASANEDWIGFGTEVIAVADGVIRDLQDGVPDNMPLASVPAQASLTAGALYGNYVVLEVGSHTFVHYAHLKRNTVSVRVGQRVHRGQLLGQLGNSGNTNGPHLHFSVQDTGEFDSEGLPFEFDSFEMLGETTTERALGAESSSGLTMASPQTAHHREIPLGRSVVRFH